jgi:hypothetical protein
VGQVVSPPVGGRSAQLIYKVVPTTWGDIVYRSIECTQFGRRGVRLVEVAFPMGEIGGRWGIRGGLSEDPGRKGQ